MKLFYQNRGSHKVETVVRRSDLYNWNSYNGQNLIDLMMYIDHNEAIRPILMELNGLVAISMSFKTSDHKILQSLKMHENIM